jgi:hypothetical protein
VNSGSLSWFWTGVIAMVVSVLSWEFAADLLTALVKALFHLFMALAVAFTNSFPG